MNKTNGDFNNYKKKKIFNGSLKYMYTVSHKILTKLSFCLLKDHAGPEILPNLILDSVHTGIQRQALEQNTFFAFSIITSM